MILCDNGEHGILGRCGQGHEAVWNILVPHLVIQLLRRQHDYIVTVVVAGELRDCALSLKLLVLKS